MADERMVRLAEIEVDPARLDEYKTLLAEVGTTSIQREPGVLMLHSMSAKQAPHHIRVFEVYASRAAYEAHIQTPHFLKYKTETADMVTALNLVDVDPILLAAK